MNKKIVLDEEKDRNIIDEWYEAAGKQTFETLSDFIQHVMNDYEHDYGTVVHAISVCALAAAWSANGMDGAMGGITGFQASYIMWMFIKHWTYNDNKCGLKLINYDDFLYPQYNHRFDKVISAEVWKNIQKEAEKLLEGYEPGSPFGEDRVQKHWESIVKGKVPFGYEVEKGK